MAAEHWAVIASSIETCKLNGVDPYAYLADVISKIVTLGLSRRNWRPSRRGCHFFGSVEKI
jgi:hypothetical protein